MSRGVIFDLDGTLVDTNYLHVVAWSRSFQDAGRYVLAEADLMAAGAAAVYKDPSDLLDQLSTSPLAPLLQ